MNIADVLLATGSGILIATVISGIFVITWLLCVSPRRTKR